VNGPRANTRRNIFELYIEEVVEACNRLKGGKLPKEQLKAQLQKIATSRTGGLKTDEALVRPAGTRGSAPFHHCDGGRVEGEVDLASQVQADAAPAQTPVETNPLRDEKPVATETRAQGKARRNEGKDAKPPKGKAAQMALFSGSDRQDRPDRPDRPDRRDRPVSASKPRGKK